MSLRLTGDFYMIWRTVKIRLTFVLYLFLGKVKIWQFWCWIIYLSCSTSSWYPNIQVSLTIFHRVRVMVFNTTFNNIIVISWRSALLVDQSTQRKLQTCRKSLTNFITLCCIKYTSPWARFELPTLVVIYVSYTLLLSI